MRFAKSGIAERTMATARENYSLFLLVNQQAEVTRLMTAEKRKHATHAPLSNHRHLSHRTHGKAIPRKAGPCTPDCDCWRPGLNQGMTPLFFICSLKNLAAPPARLLAEVVPWAAAAVLTKVIRTRVDKTFHGLGRLEAPPGNCLQPVTLVKTSKSFTGNGAFKVAACSALSKGSDLSMDMSVLDEKGLKAGNRLKRGTP